jgi:hypothetical protein
MLKFIMLIMSIALFMPSALPYTAQAKVSTSMLRVSLYVDQPQAYVNGKLTTLDSPATVVDGKTYVPVKFLGDIFAFPVQYDPSSKSISITAGGSQVLIQMQDKLVIIDGMQQPLEPTFRIINDRLMAQLTWMMERINAKTNYIAEQKRIDVTYLPLPKGVVAGENSNPVAKFTFGKSSYRLGEKIKYINLSYDVDGDGITFVSWKNNRDAFFEPGKYDISLQVTDRKGNKSARFTKQVTIIDEPYMTPLEFAMNYTDVQTFIPLKPSDLTDLLANRQSLPVAVRHVTGRKLLLSDSPESVREHGILYRDTLNGAGRLYAHHFNATSEPLKFAILATNRGTQPVTVQTTKQGEVFPSIFANLIGHQASVDFLVGDVSKDTLVVQPGETTTYSLLPLFLPNQGINLIYDIQMDGELEFTFVAMRPMDSFEEITTYQDLPYDGHVRGSFPVSELRWQVDANGGQDVQSITLGDNQRDLFVYGWDVFRRQNVPNYGNYGVLYQINIVNPGKVALVLLARGGEFKGPFKINGEMILAPNSGTIAPQDGVFLLGRTTGNEESLQIEYTPPAASSFPVDLIMVPLR